MSQFKINAFFCFILFIVLLINAFTDPIWGRFIFICGIFLIAIILLISGKKTKSKESREQLPIESSSEEEKYDYERTCEVCGKSLRTRRKYCSECRPSGRSKPFDLSKEDRRKQEEYEQYANEADRLRDAWFG